MKNSQGTLRCFTKFLLLCLFGALSISSTASAGTIFVSGDATPAFYARNNDNNMFFANVLQSGNNVFVHDLFSSMLSNRLNSYYNSLTGVNSVYLGDPVVTPGSLSGVDLFVTGLSSGGLAASELNTLNNFVNSGGTVLFMGDYSAPETYINNALAFLGSNMSLYAPILDTGDRYATGTMIATDPFTSGVSLFRYGATYGVTGGTSLFFDSTQRTFLAYRQTSPIPEPSTMLFLVSGIIGLAGFRKKFIG